MTTLSAPGLLLRPFRASDAPAFTEAVLESLALLQPWMPWSHAGYSEADALEWFRFTHAGREAGTHHEFGVFSEDGGRFLGGAGLSQFHPTHRNCNLGYWVRQSAQRQAVASRCVKVLADYAFSTLHMHRVEISAAVGNAASAAAARKAGAVWECVARNKLWLHGRAVDADVFSVVG
ncbi:MAG: GNAT family N-acetyltransferase [Rhodoferax sp.]|uniref:GNAT family N-acetyltransferase n=1 Tax=Rhodoferax sp. TaxID=50421 RepID=UPI003264E52B